MVCCINPACENPLNPDILKYCQACGSELIPLLRNRFKITKPLGQGGFGKTYLAEDTDKLFEQCVVKQLVYQIQGPQTNHLFIDLFLHEAEQLQKLGANLQIPSLFAYFEEKGYLYLVQQYIQGQNLLQELAVQGCFSEQKIQALLADLLPVIRELHHNQVIHRDIKPENIMRHHQNSKLILIDFGVSKQLSKSIYSDTGTTVGSFGYAAPEQIESGQSGPTSDLYSLGASCFHLMTDINPWSLWRLQGYGWLGQWRQHLQQPISLQLQKVLDKLLQLEPEDRYQSAIDVLADLVLFPHPNPESQIDWIAFSSQPTQHWLSNPARKKGQEAQSKRVNLPNGKSGQSSRKTSRRQFLTLASFGGVGLSSVMLWEAFKYMSTDPGPSSNLVSNSTADNLPSAPKAAHTSQSVSLQYFDFEVVNLDAQGNITKRTQAEAPFFVEELDRGQTLEMVAIPSGTFLMGSPTNELERDLDEGPQHEVTIGKFFMGKFPITQAQWQAIMKTNPSRFKGSRRPVENVSWNDANEFCQKLSQKTGQNYRLPTEAEWEYACRATTTTPFYFGETITTDLANYDGTPTYGSGPKGKYREQTTNIDIFPPNLFGLYDIHGNIWEWCQDTRHDSYEGAPTDGSAWIDSKNQYRMIRGGSWDYNPRYCRSASRGDISNPDYRFDAIGFRVVCSIST
ncbi:SUMF1/EgtB/PvdO family nonheme iron enzyme [Acaryochloris marina NIES-2412]|uniref:SUMF1/EgtB/PvdO family nonheme iron enzyme n=1 Tax=Acaryochloris marina TaxID=155978 RepID=UPI0040586EA3